MQNDFDLHDLEGRTILAVEGVGYSKDEVHFLFDDGAELFLRLQQECCERAFIEQVEGEVTDLIGSPIISASEVWEGPQDAYDLESEHLITLRTEKGSVTLHWLGLSSVAHPDLVLVGMYDHPKDGGK